MDEIKTQTELHIQFMEDTTISTNGTVPYRVEGKDGKLVRSPEAWVEYLPSVAAGTDVTRQLLLAGEHPSLKIVLGLYEEGFSFEMTENWPEPVQLHRQQDARSVLEEPFDVDGISIEKSVGCFLCIFVFLFAAICFSTTTKSSLFIIPFSSTSPAITLFVAEV